MRNLMNFFIIQTRSKTTKVPIKGGNGLWDRIMTKHLLLFNTVTSGALMFFGDGAAQLLEQKLANKKVTLKEIDWHRIGRMTAVGTIQGPMHHYYYGYVDRLFPKSDGRSVFSKIMADQFVASPLFIFSYFYIAEFFEGKTLVQANEEIKDKFLTVYIADWLIWPPFQFVNFYFLPLRYRVLYINAVTTLYNIFLCYVKHKDMKESTPAIEEK